MISICHRVELRTTSEDDDEEDIISRACVVRELPSEDQKGLGALQFPGACDDCLRLDPVAAKGKVKTIAAGRSMELKRCNELVRSRWGDTEPGEAHLRWMKGTDQLLLEIKNLQDSVWDWASLQLGVADQKNSGESALKQFINQCELLERLAQRRTYYDRKGWPKTDETIDLEPPGRES